MKRTVFTFVFAVLAFSIAVGQETKNSEDNTVTFNLKYKEGHYYINSDINGVPASMRISTGARGLIIDGKFYDKHKDELHLNLKEANKKTHISKKIYNVKLAGRAEVRIGDIIYKGPVIVVENFGEIMLPVQYLINEKDRSSIVYLDLKASKMSMLSRSRLAQDTIGCNSFPLHKTERLLLPAIYTHLTIQTNYTRAQMDGNFAIDLGYKDLLLLLKNNETVANMVEDNDSEFRPSKGSGKWYRVPNKGLRDCTCVIAGYTFHNASIGLNSKSKADGVAGLIGLKFFETPVILDFSRKRFYIKPNE